VLLSLVFCSNLSQSCVLVTRGCHAQDCLNTLPVELVLTLLHPLSLVHCCQGGVRWDTEVRLKVGAALLALLLESSTLPDGILGRQRRPAAAATVPPAAAAVTNSSSPTAAAGFEYIYVKNGVRQQAFVSATSGLVKVLLADRSNSLSGSLLVRVPPMVVPPVPWESFNIGGQLTSR
jgi:DNA-directed RNA polymerase